MCCKVCLFTVSLAPVGAACLSVHHDHVEMCFTKSLFSTSYVFQVLPSQTRGIIHWELDHDT